jgi:cytochrome P450
MMNAIHTMTPYENFPEYKEIFTSWWDIPSGIAAIALHPLTIIFKKVTEKQSPPGATGHVLLGSLPEFADMNWDIMQLVISYNKKYGKEHGICKLKLLNQTFYIVTNPVLAKEILSDSKSYKRGNSLRIWRKFSEGGLAEGEDTQAWRTQAIHFIGAKNLPHFFPGMVEISKQWNDRLGKKKHFDLFHEAERVALAAMGETFFQPVCGENPFGLEDRMEEVSNSFLKSYSDLFHMLTRRVTSAICSIPYVGDSLYGWIYSEDDQKIEDSKMELKKILTPLFETVFGNPEEVSEEANRIYDNFGIDRKKVDIDDILDKSLGFLQASFETASKGVAWILYLLGKDQTFQQRLREELLKRFGEKKPESYNDFKEVPLLLRTVEEGLRLYTPFPFLLRDIENPENFANYQVDKGGVFIISPLLMHHNPKVWEDPEKFNPDRFTDEMLTDTWQVENASYLTFLGGAHRCPGRFFAKQEISIFLCNLLMNYRVVLDEPEKVPQLKLNITLHSENPVMAHLEKL